MIRILLKEPGKPPETRDITPDLETFQALVGGDIEGWGFKKWYLYCNGNREGLKPNLYLPPLGFVYGAVVFFSGPDALGNERGLTETEADELKDCLQGFSINQGQIEEAGSN